MLAQAFPNGIWHYLIGGLLLGAGMSLLFATTGKVGGMSTVFSSTWSFFTRNAAFREKRLLDSRVWRLVYAAGLVLGAFAWWLTLGHGTPDAGVTSVPLALLAAGGFLVGFGARLSNGCTAGHGICGLASLQLPSLLAVMVFVATAMAVAHLVRFLAG